MNEHFISGDALEDAPRFLPCAHFYKFGAQKVFYGGGGGGGGIKETREEQELARIAGEKWKHYQENYVPIENRYMQEVDKMDTEGAYDFARGASGSATAAAFADPKQRMHEDLTSAGVNPNSGKYKASMSRVADAQGLSSADSMSRSTIDQQDQFVQGVSNISALGRGQATAAQAGLTDVAGTAANKAASDAFSAWNSRSANVNAAGAVFGAGAHALSNRSSAPTATTDPGVSSANFYTDRSSTV